MDFSRVATVPGLPSVLEKIGKYEVIKELGKGATSSVYHAYDPFQNVARQSGDVAVNYMMHLRRPADGAEARQ